MKLLVLFVFCLELPVATLEVWVQLYCGFLFDSLCVVCVVVVCVVFGGVCVWYFDMVGLRVLGYCVLIGIMVFRLL